MTNPQYRFNIYLLQYNNYYNRQIKKYPRVDGYIDAEDVTVLSSYNANIDIKDMIKTNIIVNYNNFLATPNYVLIEDLKDPNNIHLSRWFVIECRQLRGCQYELYLKRDVISDYWDAITRSPILLYKGYVPNDNVLVFNKEQQEYNKKKMAEYLIKDPENTGYVVGFIGKDKNYDGNITTTYSAGITPNFDYDALSQTMKNYFAIGSATPVSTVEDRTMSHVIINNVSASIGFYQRSTGNKTAHCNGLIPLYRNITDSDLTTSWNPPGTLTGHITFTGVKNGPEYTAYTDATVKSDIIKPVYNHVRSIMTSKLNNKDINYDTVLNVDRSFINTLQSYNNKICCINNVYYKCEFMKVANGIATKNNDNYSFTRDLRECLPTYGDLSSLSGFTLNSANYDNFTTTDVDIDYLKYNCYIKLTQQSYNIKTVLTSKASRNHLIDAPYDMFVMPYSDTYQYVVSGVTYTANKNMAINLAQGICEATGANSVYDIQIVPYNPFDITNHDWTNLNKEAIKLADNTVIGYYFWADKSSNQISVNETNLDLTLANNPSYKEVTQLKRYMLCSPDKHDMWEFNPAMNYGINKWLITYDYRPFQSYMKIQPEFKENSLYGVRDFDGQTDLRGLLINCGYSLTQLNDAWATYVSNNKNYQDIFDTQINSQVKQYDIQNKAAWDTMIQRSANASLGGGLYEIANLLTGGQLGSKADAVRKEQEMTEQIQGITLETSRALFNYQLDNIKNQPDTIRKLTSLNQDFRIWPFVEVYECSEQEKLIFRDMIRYNGMTLMVTGYIENYLKNRDETFIQGNLIRFFDNLEEENDFTLVQDINNELNKGIYVYYEVNDIANT